MSMNLSDAGLAPIFCELIKSDYHYSCPFLCLNLKTFRVNSILNSEVSHGVLKSIYHMFPFFVFGCPDYMLSNLFIFLVYKVDPSGLDSIHTNHVFVRMVFLGFSHTFGRSFVQSERPSSAASTEY